MAAKVTFTVPEKIIYIHSAPVQEGSDWVIDIDVKEDLYSDGKEDWRTGGVLTGFDFPLRAVGGDALPGSKALGSTFFLASDWKIRPYEGSHTLRVNGNMYSEDGSSPFIPTVGIFNVTIISTVSSLVDSTVQQLAEIEYISFGGQVSVDMYNGSGQAIDGTDYPAGNMEYPCLHTHDAVSIAHSRGFKKIGVRGNLLLGEGDNVNGYTLVGDNPIRTTITVLTESSTLGVEFKECKLTGILDGYSIVRDCMIENLDYINGYVYNSILSYVGTIRLGGGNEAHFIDCVSSKPGVGTPTIDCGGSGQALAMREYNGGIRLMNKSGPESISIDLGSGQVRLDPDTFHNGVLVARGNGKIVNDITDEHIHDNWNGCTILNETNHPLCNARAVWITQLSDYAVIVDSAAEALSTASGTTQQDIHNALDAYPNKVDYKADVSLLATSAELANLNDPSLPDIVTGILDATAADHNLADTIGESINDGADSKLTEIELHAVFDNYANKDDYKSDLGTLNDPTAAEISTAVWADSPATQLVADINFIKDIEGGRWKIISNQMVFYKEDNATEIARFNLLDTAGNPTEQNVAERQRV